MLDMNEHIYKNDDDSGTPFHSNGYAQAANQGRIGSTSNTSFEKRMQIEQNRSNVAAYRFSSLGRSNINSYNAKTYSDNKKTSDEIRMETNVRQGRLGGLRADMQRQQQQNRQTTSQPRRYIEPPKRNYNPYS